MTRRDLSLQVERWPCQQPFRISGRTWTQTEVLVCEIREGQHVGRGEAMGVYYLAEDGARMRSQVEQAAEAIRQGADRGALLDLMPPGGARNAVDCALWDLEARCGRTTAWAMAGVENAAVTTVFTIGLEREPRMMAAKAHAAADRPNLKIKLDADRPVERIAAIRQARADARLIIDVNGGWSFDQLRDWAPAMKELGVLLLEQPLPRGGDLELLGYDSPVPLFADESCLGEHELEHAAACYDGLVIKLDKTGGLTSALNLVRRARDLDLRLMTGCMVGTSLAMAPAHVLAQHCEFVDIDGPLLLARDRANGLRYDGASVTCPAPALWGMAG